MMGSARKRPDRFDDITELHRHLVDGKPVQRETSDRRCDEEIETVNKMLQASGFQTKIIPLAKSVSLVDVIHFRLSPWTEQRRTRHVLILFVCHVLSHRKVPKNRLSRPSLRYGEC